VQEFEMKATGFIPISTTLRTWSYTCLIPGADGDTQSYSLIDGFEK